MPKLSYTRRLYIAKMPKAKLVGYAAVFDKVANKPTVAQIRKTDVVSLSALEKMFNYGIYVNNKIVGNLTYTFKEAVKSADKPCLYVGFLENWSDRFSRVGENLLKLAYTKAPEGRIKLMASTINEEKGSPILFYFKKGFKSLSEKVDFGDGRVVPKEVFEDGLHKIQQNLPFMPEAQKKGIKSVLHRVNLQMYLSEEGKHHFDNSVKSKFFLFTKSEGIKPISFRYVRERLKL